MLTVDRLYNEFLTFVGDSTISKIKFIRYLNLVLLDLRLTKPAEQLSKIYYCRNWNKYPMPDESVKGFIALHDDNYSFFKYISGLIFRSFKPSYCYTDQSDEGVRYLLVNKNNTDSKSTSMTECDSLTADGVWTIAGGSNLSINETEYKSGGGSLQFDVSGTQTTLTFTRTNVIDASDYTEHLRTRLYAKFPTLPSSIVIRIGNDASNYFEHTLTKQVSGEKFNSDEFNELEFSRQSATETGTVDLDNVDWFQIELNFSTSTTDTEFLIDKIEVIKPEPLNLEWYTAYVATDADGDLTEKITESADTTDVPLIHDYPDYLTTVLNGLAWFYLKNKAPDEAADYKQDYFAEYDRRGNLVGGKRWLDRIYPDRTAKYRRTKRLPSLYNNFK